MTHTHRRARALPLTTHSVYGTRQAARCCSASSTYCRSRLPGETFAVRRTFSCMHVMPKPLRKKRTDSARLLFHVDLQSRGTSSGRWSRRGREVPFGKRHLQRAKKQRGKVPSKLPAFLTALLYSIFPTSYCGITAAAPHFALPAAGVAET